MEAKKLSIIVLAAVLFAASYAFLFSGCSGYVVTEEESSPLVIDGHEDHGITVTLNTEKRGIPLSPGDEVEIYWQSAERIDAVSIELYRGDDYVLEIEGNYAAGAPYTWTIPTSLAEDETYTIRVTDVTEGKSRVLYGISGYFAVSPDTGYGLSDVEAGRREITITLTDNGSLVDGDTVTITLNGTPVAADHVLVGPPGTAVPLSLQSGINTLEIYAVNEGDVSPNTALLELSDVITGEASQQWRLLAGETGSLDILAP